MLRREVMRLGGSLFGLGAGTPSRFPYPGRPQPSPGVSPSPGAILRARVIIVSGPNGGIFLYSGTPAAGNPPIASVTTATADPFGNPVKRYITVYGTNGSAVQLQPGASAAANLYSGDASEATPGLIKAQVIGSGALRFIETAMAAPRMSGEAAGASAFVLVQSPSADLSVPPQVALQSTDGTQNAFLTLAPDEVRISGNNGAAIWIFPSGDATGALDSANLTANLGAGTAVMLAGGTYNLKSPLVMPAGSYLDMGAATVQPGSAWATPPPVAMITLNSGCTLKGGTLYGGTNTRNLNPATDAITLAAGATQVIIRDVTCNFMNGWILNATVTASAHCKVRGITGTNNAGGIQLTAAAGLSAQFNIGDVNVQRCEVTEALLLDNVFDILVCQFNASVLGSAGVPTVHLVGQVTTCKFGQMDCGVIAPATAGIPVLLIEDGGGHSVTDCGFSDSTYQAGGIGIAVNGGTARCQWSQVNARNNAGDGWQFNGTGTALSVTSGLGNGNAGLADVNVTSTAHVGLDQFAYCSTTTTDSLSVVAGNHVSNNNPTSPGGKAVAGVPAGW